MSTDLALTEQPQSPSKRQTLRRWVLRITLALAIIAPLIFVFAAVGAKIGLWGWQLGLGPMTRQIGPAFLTASLMGGVISLLLALLIKPRKGLVIAAIAILIPVIAFARLSQVRSTVATLPLIHDITTDTQDPPSFGASITAERAKDEGVNTLDYVGKRAPTRQRDADGQPVMKLVSALQTQAYPEIRTLIINEPLDVTFGRAEQTARDLGWKIKESDVETGRIDATDVTFWYGFKDDVTIRLRPATGGGTRVDIRSVSRVGMSDIGANAARIKDFLDAMSAE